MLTTVIDSMRVQPDLKLQSFKKYNPYLEMTFESVILELKMKTYAE
jgi:hypothetical protein